MRKRLFINEMDDVSIAAIIWRNEYKAAEYIVLIGINTYLMKTGRSV